VPAIDSYYAYIDMPVSRFSMASIELNDSTMVELLDRQDNHCKRIFYDPLLKIRASIGSNMTQKNLQLNLTVSSPTETKRLDSVLRLYNFQLPLAATYGDSIQLSLNVTESGNSASY